jgi:hypothetical protein
MKRSVIRERLCLAASTAPDCATAREDAHGRFIQATVASQGAYFAGPLVRRIKLHYLRAFATLCATPHFSELS